MIKYRCNPPTLIKKAFKDFIWNSATEKILLTFDDGPIPETTETILKILNKNKLKAVFFCVGNNILRNPSLAENILSEGHLIGNHTFNHKQVTKISRIELDEEIISFNKLLEDRFGRKIKYFRPPYGKFNLGLKKKLREKNMTNVMWSLLTYDFKSDINIYKDIVKNYLEPNSIVVLHDSIKAKSIIPESIEFLLESISGRKYIIGDPSECLK